MSKSKGRKDRKQLRKSKSKQFLTSSEINKMARNWAKACSLMPRRPHDQDRFIEDGKLGCFISAGYEPKIWCEECSSKGYCSKEVRWIITGETMEARNDYQS